ncbi:putative sieve element occlusion [Rosa chinensis]|uniref:Putative sieve element occlusion n=1 Tax=Rosa chinensis TaxID=74649 RepID=A0A2P6R130_ROSCH|nr:protein SIEVE ELEMENT OCCLUSION B [Rosa chinensis]PRQ40118.1 putative sieve element occlusion [Rosa chinensis]
MAYQPQNKVNLQSSTPVPQSAYVAQNALVPQNKAPTTHRRGEKYRTPSQQLGRDGRRQFSTLTSDDSALITQVLDTDRSHERPYDATPISLKHILQAVEVIFSRVTKPDIHGNLLVPGSALVPTGAYTEALEHHEKALHASLSSLHDNYEVPISLFNAISSELFGKWLSGEDANKTTMDILRIVQHYDWDEKVVLTLGAFSVKDGEFWLVAQLYTINALAKAVGTLRQLPEILERASTVLKSKFDAYNNLVNTVLKVTKCIIQLQEVRRDPHLTTELESTTSTAHIPTAAYWTIRSIVVAASQLLGITGMGPEYVTEAWELSSLSHKLENIHSHLEETIKRLNDIIQRKKDDEALAAIAYILETPHIDNTKTLRVLFFKDDQPALYDGYSKRRVDIDVLKRKVVILFLSDLDVAQENEYMIAHQMYDEKRQFPTRPESQYEIVWVPIVDNWNEAKYQQFENLKNDMEWYSVFHPSVVSPTVIRYIRKQDKWNFVKKPLLVVVDPQGKIVHTNAVHMMCVFGSAAYPFTNNRERLLWENETWRMELLADSLDQNLLGWIHEGKFICLYGGEDITWIRDFTRAARGVALEAGIQLELLYMGKSKAKEQKLRSIMRIIEEEKLSHVLDRNLIWYFWIRLESMWQSKGQQLKNELLSSTQLRAADSFSLRNDPVLKGIISLLSFGSTERGWAVIGTGSADMSKANGEHMLRSLREYTAWEKRRRELGFTPALNEYLAEVYKSTPHHCTNLVLPATGLMPETVACAECGRLMERYTMFRCCTD